MDRRDFLGGLAAAGMASSLPFGAVAETAMQARAVNFKRALKDRPWLLGYQGTNTLTFTARPGEIAVEGRIPAALNGTFYRNGPALHEVAGHRYAHWFDADGLLHGFDLRDGAISHRGQVMATPKHVSERTEGRPLYDTFGTDVPDSRSIRGPDDLNPANINVLHHAGRLLALWEGGSPAEIDPVTLQFRQFVSFSPETGGMPFSAHTRTDSDGTLWSIGYAGYAGKIVLYRIDPAGQLQGLRLLDALPTPMLHDFIVTSRHLILIMPPWHYDNGAGATFLDRHVWRPDQGGMALVIDKNNLQVTHRIDLPAFWVFHFANAWETPDGAIQFDFPRYRDPGQTIKGFRQIMDGDDPEGALPDYVRAVIDPQKGTYRDEVILSDVAPEFPNIMRGMTGRRHSQTLLCLAGVGTDSRHPGFDGTAVIDPESGKMQKFVHYATEMAEEAIFATDDTGRAWIMQTVFDFEQARTKLKIIDPSQIADGPVAVATLPYALPLGLHGLFVSATGQT